MIVSRLSFASVYSTICTKYIVIAYKICYKGSLDFGIPGVQQNQTSRRVAYQNKLSTAKIKDINPDHTTLKALSYISETSGF